MCHSPMLPLMAQMPPTGVGKAALPTSPKAPRIRPTSGGGALCEPCTPAKVLGYFQSSFPLAVS
jgi:hypothetical protein